MFKHVAYLVILGSCTVAALAGNGWRTMVVDSSPGLSFHTSLAVLPSGAPAISYHKEPYLRYATLDGQEWKATVVDAEGVTGHHTSLTILPNGQPAISYYRYDTGDLKYAWFDSQTWQTTTVDGADDVGTWTSLAVIAGRPAISYRDNTRGTSSTPNSTAPRGRRWSSTGMAMAVIAAW